MRIALTSFLHTHLVQVFMVINVSSSISIVVLNKWILLSFRYGYVLTFIHFLITYIGLLTCVKLGIFDPKPLAVIKVLPLAMAFCGFVVFTNLSLVNNSIGFYQVAKMMTTPVIVCIQSLFYNMTFSTQILQSLCVIIIGVCLNSYSDFQLNLLGSVYAAIGVLSTSLYQIWVNRKQKEFDVNSMQLLYYQAPLAALLLLCVIPFTEQLYGNDGLFSFKFTIGIVGALVISGVVAFMVNLSIFFIIGKTSPITYNVLGHAKLGTILLSGFIIFKEPFNQLQCLSVILTLGGAIAYTYFKLKDNNQLPDWLKRTIIKEVPIKI